MRGITSPEPTFSIRIEPRGEVAEVRMRAIAAAAYVRRFNRVMKSLGVQAQMIAEGDRINWPTGDPVPEQSQRAP